MTALPMATGASTAASADAALRRGGATAEEVADDVVDGAAWLGLGAGLADGPGAPAASEGASLLGTPSL